MRDSRDDSTVNSADASDGNDGNEGTKKPAKAKNKHTTSFSYNYAQQNKIGKKTLKSGA
jgi:hypothetical protein